MIFSLGLAILNGLSSLFPGLGIITLRLGDHEYFPLFSWWAVFSNHLLFMPSNVVLLVPFDMFPGLLFISR